MKLRDIVIAILLAIILAMAVYYQTHDPLADATARNCITKSHSDRELAECIRINTRR
jgi:hypothetical protein